MLSLFLEHQLARIAPASGFDLIVPVPSSAPTIVSSLARAEREGWWVPRLATDVARADPRYPRQREREGRERPVVEGKWTVEDCRWLEPTVLLLDDLVTTGGTLHSLARAFRDAGARRVTAVVIARNVGKDGEWIQPLLRKEVAGGRPWTANENKHDVMRGSV